MCDNAAIKRCPAQYWKKKKNLVLAAPFVLIYPDCVRAQCGKMRAVLVVLDLVLFTVYTDSTGTRSKKHLTFAAGRSDSAADEKLARSRSDSGMVPCNSIIVYIRP